MANFWPKKRNTNDLRLGETQKLVIQNNSDNNSKATKSEKKTEIEQHLWSKKEK